MAGIAPTSVASRPQAMTRDLETNLVVSGALVAAVEREAVDVALLAALHPRGAQPVRGRDAPIDLWTG